MKRLPQFFLQYPLVPGEEAINGIKFDFCDGCRILFPLDADAYRVVLTDLDSDCVIEDVICHGGDKFKSQIHYYVNWKLDIYHNDELVFTHSLDLVGKEVFIELATRAIGDTLAWFPYIEAFRKKHKCKVGVHVIDSIRVLIETEYPEIQFFDKNALRMLSPYALYKIGIDFTCSHKINKRYFYSVPLHYMAGYDLGFDNDIEQPFVKVLTREERLVEEPYVCLSLKGSMRCKCWLNYYAIDDVVAELKKEGYRVLLVDLDNDGLHGAEDWTGNRPLVERATLFRDADCVIAMPSGLAWLANAVTSRVVLVSGFSEPWSEFRTIHRVQNSNVCHGCWNNPKLMQKWGVENADTFCPSFRDFECTRKISAKMVLDEVFKVLSMEGVK